VREGNPKNKITYICDAKDCEEERTIFKSVYKLRTNHFCSNECKYTESKGRSKFLDRIEPKKLAKTVSERIADYFKEKELK